MIKKTWKMAKILVIALVVALVFIGIMAAGNWFKSFFKGAGFSNQLTSTAVFTAIMKESPDQFLLVGNVEINSSVTSTVSSGFDLGAIGRIPMGKTEVEIKVPGRVHYGFDFKEFKEEDINVENGIVTIRLPKIVVKSIEPLLDQTQVRTSGGSFQKLQTQSQIMARDAAYSRLTDALRQQADSHLTTNQQPRINGAHALIHILNRSYQASNTAVTEYHFIFDDGTTHTIKPSEVK